MIWGQNVLNFAGIGLGIAHRLGAEGAKLVICSRKQVSLPSFSVSSPLICSTAKGCSMQWNDFFGYYEWSHKQHPKFSFSKRPLGFCWSWYMETIKPHMHTCLAWLRVVQSKIRMCLYAASWGYIESGQQDIIYFDFVLWHKIQQMFSFGLTNFHCCVNSCSLYLHLEVRWPNLWQIVVYRMQWKKPFRACKQRVMMLLVRLAMLEN